MDADDLKRIAGNLKKLYSYWEMPKPNGGYRPITSPKPVLKTIQKRIHNLLQEIQISDCAHGGIKGRSHYTNAKIHCNTEWLYKLDFKSFFPSIPHTRVFYLFKNELKCSTEVASVLTKLCTYNGCVPQGSPTSTDIANLVCRSLDKRLEELAKSFGLTYSRFVDDIHFSGQNLPERFKILVKKTISSAEWITIHPAKEDCAGRFKQQIVTGLNIKKKQPAVPRVYKRQVRAEMYKHRSKAILNKENQYELSSCLYGKCRYINSVENP